MYPFRLVISISTLSCHIFIANGLESVDFHQNVMLWTLMLMFSNLHGTVGDLIDMKLHLICLCKYLYQTFMIF